jgi:hypothetical protein
MWGTTFEGSHFINQNTQGCKTKDKDLRFNRKLSVEEVDDACSRAVDFKPELGEFTVATTAPRDVEIQMHVRLLDDTSRFPFDVNVWHWDDIEEEVRFRPGILETKILNRIDKCLAEEREEINQIETEASNSSFRSLPWLPGNSLVVHGAEAVGVEVPYLDFVFLGWDIGKEGWEYNEFTKKLDEAKQRRCHCIGNAAN